VFLSSPLRAARRLATGKIDGSLQPSSSLVASRAFQAPAYVNTDCGAKAWAFDRIQVNAPVRMVAAEARMVGFASRSSVNFVVTKKTPQSLWGAPPLDVSTLRPA
jgi:hypothetical protein